MVVCLTLNFRHTLLLFSSYAFFSLLSLLKVKYYKCK